MKPNTAQRSYTKSTPAPVGGLNDRDSIASMPEQDAITLTNMFPNTNSVDIRGGSVEHLTGLPSVGETLMSYNGVSGNKLYVAAGTAIYDATTAGAVGAAVVSAMANARWDYVNFGGAAGNFLCAVNGVNLPQFYNGTAWTQSGTGYATAITGVTASNFNQVNAWKNRLFFVEKNTLKCWYLGVQSIGGAATAIDFSGVAKLGGKLIATATVSVSAGSTIDDFLVAITSEGEVMVYQGTDPASAATFGLVGNYRIGRPIANGTDNQGGRFLARLSSQLVSITIGGFVNLQDSINTDVQAKRATINDKIVNTVSRAVDKYKANFGWQALVAPAHNKLFINVPTIQGSGAYQYVMNTITGAWSVFEGWNTACLGYFNDDVYGCIGTKVYRLDIAQSNDFVAAGNVGTPVSGLVETAYQYHGNRGALKSYKMVRPLFFSSSQVYPGITVNIDFKNGATQGTASSVASTSALWDAALWDVALWPGADVFSQNWASVFGIGYCSSLRMSIKCDSQLCQFQAWDVIYERGGLM
jgi:hypothetical protein